MLITIIEPVIMVNSEVPNDDYFYFTKEAIKMRSNPVKVTFKDINFSVMTKIQGTS
jgi:hypothetical protein